MYVEKKIHGKIRKRYHSATANSIVHCTQTKYSLIATILELLYIIVLPRSTSSNASHYNEIFTNISPKNCTLSRNFFRVICIHHGGITFASNYFQGCFSHSISCIIGMPLMLFFLLEFKKPHRFF